MFTEKERAAHRMNEIVLIRHEAYAALLRFWQNKKNDWVARANAALLLIK